MNNIEFFDMNNIPLFELGHTVVTRRVLKIATHEEIQWFFYLHCHGVWGDVPLEDSEANDTALVYGGVIMSVYHTADGTKVWVITEADRSCTTILLPDEY